MEKSWMLVDEKVIQDAINKEENAINLIYEQTINSAYFVAQTHACNISYINDILQDSYIRVFDTWIHYMIIPNCNHGLMLSCEIRHWIIIENVKNGHFQI